MSDDSFINKQYRHTIHRKREALALQRQQASLSNTTKFLKCCQYNIIAAKLGPVPEESTCVQHPVPGVIGLNVAVCKNNTPHCGTSDHSNKAQQHTENKRYITLNNKPQSKGHDKDLKIIKNAVAQQTQRQHWQKVITQIDRGKGHQNYVNNVQGIIQDVHSKLSMSKGKEQKTGSSLPEGFFDDQQKDKEVRGVAAQEAKTKDALIDGFLEEIEQQQEEQGAQQQDYDEEEAQRYDMELQIEIGAELKKLDELRDTVKRARATAHTTNSTQDKDNTQPTKKPRLATDITLDSDGLGGQMGAKAGTGEHEKGSSGDDSGSQSESDLADDDGVINWRAQKLG